MTYPGESVILDSAYEYGAGSPFALWNQIAYRAGSRTLASGGHWKMWADTYFNPLYLGASDTGTVSWVVEVTAGSGTVTAAEGVDPGFGDDTFVAGTALGSHALAVGTNVIPSGMSAADVYGLTVSFAGVPMLDLSATAGSVTVQQVKLQLLPVGGATGAWVTHPAFDTTPANATVYVGTADGRASNQFYGDAVNSDPEAAWDAAVAAMQADVATLPGPHTATSLSGYHEAVADGLVSVILTDLAPEYTATASVQNRYALVRGVDWAAQHPIASTLTEGVDWWRPPAEVYGDVGYYAQQLGTGTVGWVDLNVTVDVDPIEGGALIGGAVAVAYPPTVTVASLGGGAWSVDVDYIGVGSAVTDGQTLTLTPAGSRHIFLAPTNQTIAGAVPWNSTFGTFGEAVTVNVGSVSVPVKSYATMPPYRVWNADASPATVRPLRQFHTDWGMGGTPPRGFGGTSHARTGRAFGDY